MPRKTLLVGLLLGVCSATAMASDQECRYQSLRESTPTARFSDQADGTVLDHSTGLMWSVCALGQSWSAEGCDGVPLQLSWEDVLTRTYTENLAGRGIAGHNDWRLPNIRELLSIVERACTAPSLNRGVFVHNPGTPEAYWSSTPLYFTKEHWQDEDRASPRAWAVDFSDGSMDVWETKWSYPIVRLVRDHVP